MLSLREMFVRWPLAVTREALAQHLRAMGELCQAGEASGVRTEISTELGRVRALAAGFRALAEQAGQVTTRPSDAQPGAWMDGGLTRLEGDEPHELLYRALTRALVGTPRQTRAAQRLALDVADAWDAAAALSRRVAEEHGLPAELGCFTGRGPTSADELLAAPDDPYALVAAAARGDADRSAEHWAFAAGLLRTASARIPDVGPLTEWKHKLLEWASALAVHALSLEWFEDASSTSGPRRTRAPWTNAALGICRARLERDDGREARYHWALARRFASGGS